MDASAVRERAADLPREPGVYQFIAREGRGSDGSPAADGERVLYVGKAVDLGDRVRTYADPRGQRIRRMVGRANDLEVAVTDTETQALLLEANLIKRHQPRYNVRLKDDKSYPLVQLTAHEAPRIQITRDPADDATVFGPFTDVGRLETVVKALRETYGLRACSDHKYAGRDRPCIDFDIGLCTAPCTGEIDLADYAEDVEAARRFLSGEIGVLADPLEDAMETAADAREFERAANLRDRLEAVEALHGTGGGAVAGPAEAAERRVDVLGVSLEGSRATVARLHAEDGQLVDRERHRLDGPADAAGDGDGGRAERAAGGGDGGRAEDPGRGIENDTLEGLTGSGVPEDEAGAVLAAFIAQYYAERQLPEAILCSHHPVDQELRTWLDAEGVEVRVPGTGREATLVDLALKNARRQGSAVEETGALAAALGLDSASRIEGFDVSHAGGRHVVGSDVVFVDGAAEKRDYRRKKLSEDNDDYANMAALVGWRAERAVDGRDDRPDPDLLLVDGGEGQLAAARTGLNRHGWDVPVVALAKAEERVVTPDGGAGLDADSPEVRLLRRVRDEAHRFARQYHETLRDEVSTVLEEVPGIGPTTRRRLLRRFGSVEGVRAASETELRGVEGVGEATAATIADRLG
ncbi:MAG: excinuclease ABC subunit C [Haloarculaceae archaeon]